ncbi:hypothetical protein D3C85_696590 [compost metagenome]
MFVYEEMPAREHVEAETRGGVQAPALQLLRRGAVGDAGEYVQRAVQRSGRLGAVTSAEEEVGPQDGQGQLHQLGVLEHGGGRALQ